MNAKLLSTAISSYMLFNTFRGKSTGPQNRSYWIYCAVHCAGRI